ncbi:MAG: RsmG family class I SAM-dependent methyltransferase [Microthrixaceae bacterium]
MEPALVEQLTQARSLGFLGPGPVEDHIAHAMGFVRALGQVSGTVVDLGSGGGVPGLVVGLERPDLDLVLIDATAKRCAFLESAVVALGLAHITVVLGRAEEVGRSERRGTAAAVIARGFGPPAVTAECAAPLLRVGGLLVVSEPPSEEGRWPEAGAARVGLRPTTRSESPALQLLVQESLCPDRFPRRIGKPGKDPLF